MRKALLILAMPIVLLMVGCAEEDASRDPQVNGSAMVKGMPIDFGADDAGDTTRISPYLTRTAVNTLNLSGIQTSGFGVFAAHTGLHTYANSSISSNFMYNQKVTYSSSNWTYSPIKYWPNGEDGSDLPDYISFFAYAPYSETASACITDFPLPIEMGDPWLIYRLADDVASQVDLLYATPVLDKTKPADNTTDEQKKVNFKFKHALACVGDKVTTSISEALGDKLKDEVADKASLTKIEVILRKVSIVYTLTQKGKLSLASSTALWKPVMSGEFTTKRTVTVFDGSASPFTLATITDAVAANEHSVSDKGVFYIPLQVGNEPQQATCTLDYSIVRTFSDASTTTFNGNTTNTIGLQAAGGEIAGAHLNLNLNLSENIRVKPYDFTGFSILPINDVIYTGSALEPVVVVTNGNKTLVKDVDYTVSYTNNVNVGVGTVTINGKGEYDEDVTLTANFNITQKPLTITANAQTVTYGTAITQGTNQVTTNSLCAGHTLSAITLTQSTTNATTSGTITPSAATIMDGNNNVTSNYNITYNTGTLTINKASSSMSNGDGTVSFTASQNTNSTIERTITCTNCSVSGASVTSGSGFSVSHSGNTITVTRTSASAFSGTITVTGTASDDNHSDPSNITISVSAILYDSGVALADAFVGYKVCSNGKAYATDATLPSGVTVIGMVGYKDGSSGIVLYREDNSGTYTWDNRNNGNPSAVNVYVSDLSSTTTKSWSCGYREHYEQCGVINLANWSLLQQRLVSAGCNTLGLHHYWASNVNGSVGSSFYHQDYWTNKDRENNYYVRPLFEF